MIFMGGFNPPSIQPAMPPQNYTSYTVTGRRRKATCEEAGCLRYDNGWQTIVDEATDLGARQAAYIRSLAGRRFRERHEGGLTHFEFYPGQQCFEQHHVSLDAPRYLKVGGDYRGNPRGEFLEHRNMDDWVNDFGEHQDALRKAQS